MRSSTPSYQMALTAAVISGTAALTHELLWTRRLVDLLGATHEASARVIACFFLGLSLGSACIAWTSPRVQRPWRAACIVELLVAVACLPVLFLPELYGQVWRQLGPAQLVGGPGKLWKLAISAAVVVPPAFGMGMTIPLMVAGVARAGHSPRARGIWLYAGNTAGGVLGILLATEWWLWSFGVRGSILLSLALNTTVAVLCFLLDRVYAGAPAGPGGTVASGNSDRSSAARNRSLRAITNRRDPGWASFWPWCPASECWASKCFALHCFLTSSAR